MISDSLYLWHWSVLTISRLTIGVDFRTIPFQLAAIFILSVLSYKFAEKPLRVREWRVVTVADFRIGAIGHSAAIALAMAAVILFIAVPLHKEGYLYTGTFAPLTKKGTGTLREGQIFDDYAWEGNRCVLSSDDDVGKVIQPEDCTFGAFASAKRRFLVIGDSFSAAEIEMYQILVKEKRGAVTVTSSWGASPVPEVENRTIYSKANDYYWTAVVPALIDRLQAGDVLLMVNDGASYTPKKHTKEYQKKIKPTSKRP